MIASDPSIEVMYQAPMLMHVADVFAARAKTLAGHCAALGQGKRLGQ